MTDKCPAVHPTLGVQCILDSRHVEPDGFDMGQYTDYSSMAPGRSHAFTVEWLDDLVKPGHFADGKVWPPR